MRGRGVAAAVVMLLLGVPARMSVAQKADAERVAGKVVSAIDGHPLPHAEVTLTDLKTEETSATATADKNGNYVFEPVAPGKYRLTGAAAHFLPTYYLQHEFYSTAIVTGAGCDTSSLVLRLVPAASISGRVVDDAGEPVEHAVVQLYREDLTGSERVVRYGAAQTADDGEYEFHTVNPGRYFLSATAVPWYAMHAEAEGLEVKPPYRAAVDPVLDVAYPMTFFADATDSGGAVALNVGGGEQITANMTLHAQHALTLTLHLAPGDDGGRRGIMLSRDVFGTQEPMPLPMENSEGTMKMVGIPPGRYSLEDFGGGDSAPMNSNPVDLSSASATIDLSKRQPMATVTATIHATDGAGELTAVGLRNLKLNQRVSPSTMDKGVATFANVAPGDYGFSAYGNGKIETVLGVSMGGKAVPEMRLHIAGTESVAVDLRVSSAAIQVEGFVRRAGKQGPGSMVVLVPAGSDTGSDLFRRDQSDLDGSFLFRDVVPGNYIVIAVDDGWPLRWTDVAALTPYLMRGEAVSIAARGGTVHLAAPVNAQAR